MGWISLQTGYQKYTKKNESTQLRQQSKPTVQSQNKAILYK